MHTLLNIVMHSSVGCGDLQTKHLGWHSDLTWMGSADRTWLNTVGWTHDAGRKLARKYHVFYIGRPLAVDDAQ